MAEYVFSSSAEICATLIIGKEINIPPKRLFIYLILEVFFDYL